MNKIVKYLDTRAEVAAEKEKLIVDDVMFAICKENYIATLNPTGDEYVDFNNEIKTSYFRDCFLNANSTILFVCRNDVLESASSLTYLFANIWYTVLSEYVPLERFGSKIRDFNNQCVADFVSDAALEGNVTIGYINVGNTFEQPNYNNLVSNRDTKDCCYISEEYFPEIIDKVFNYINELIGG